MKHIHLIGIGGISMSAIAELLLHQGVKVSGSDIENSNIINKLKSHGAEVFIGHSASSIKNPDLVVYTAAVNEDNPERMEARRLNIPQIGRAEILGDIMAKYDTPIAISGSHGKTTTTSMLSIFLENSGFDPTILVGGELDEIGGNVKIGKSQYFITEACEYVESFLKFKPFVGVILNIDVDHLDYFQDLAHIKSSFKKFASLIPNNGFLIACGDDSNTMDVTGDLGCNLVTFGIDNNCDYKAENVTFNKLGYPSFEVFHSGAKLGNFELNVRGQHNIYNTLASIATAHILGMSNSQLVDSAKLYKGIHRRFEFKGNVNGAEVYDDYAHHPVEIKATLSAAKKFVEGDIWCIFQPHTYTRTRSLLEDFSTSFDLADHLIMADIYAAREIDDGTIHSKNIVELTKNNIDSLYIQDFTEIVEYIYNNIKPNDIVITMGAGDIFKVADLLISKYS